MSTVAIVAALAGVCLAAMAPPAEARIAKRPLTTGFADPLFGSSDAGVRARWLDNARGAGARVIRLAAFWSAVSPSVPSPIFNPSNPADPEYNWDGLDAAVRDASDRGLRVLLTASSAPAWAEGPGRPANADPGTWRPDPGGFAAFGTALASRYSGSFPDPARPGQNLPAVHAYQAWNEPNLYTNLDPQWDGNSPVSPGIYRALLNAFYAAVKSVQPSATVVMAGTAPYGDAPGGRRVPPVTFDRVLFCADNPVCPAPARFDVFAHHPINVGAPSDGASNVVDATTPDLRRLKRALRDGVRAGGVAPAGPKPIWVTEIWWDSKPPDPDGVPLRKQARWTAEAMEILWRQGASVVIFLQIADSPPLPDYPSSSQSGIFFEDGRPKPSLKAFRFPFVARKLDRRRVEVWGKPPRGGRVKIQRRVGGHWRTISRLGASAEAPFVRRLRLRGTPKLRAKSRAATSIGYTTTGD
jgi:hypothetical protein